MGSNDHNPTGSARLSPWKVREPQALLSWGNINPELVLSLVHAASKIGAYVGFGSNADRTALLLYVKNGRLNERVAIESVKESQTGLKWVLDNWLEGEH